MLFIETINYTILTVFVNALVQILITLQRGMSGRP
jgi:hypothetical protein